MRTIKLLAIFGLGLMLVIGAGCERKITTEGNGDDLSSSDCFTCHGDEGVLLAAKGEWQNSIHASGNNVDYTNRGGSDCSQCHQHAGFLEYVETGEVSAPYSNVSAIHCFTCHAPHERGDLTLRVDDAYTLANDEVFDHGSANLCVNCHHSRYDVTEIADGISVNRYWGPHHGPQGDLLIGTGGYEFTGVSYESSPHASAVTDGCIGCHMGNPQTHIGYKIGGHSFNMLDEESGDDLSGICAQESCHPSAEDFDYESAQTIVDSLLDSLGVILLAEGLIDGSDYPVSGTIADGATAGAVYNFKLIHEDRSKGIHNFEYIKGLLDSSIDHMESVIATKARGEEWAHNPKSSH